MSKEYDEIRGIMQKRKEQRLMDLDHKLKNILNKKVKLKSDVLVQHSRSVPAHAGYSKEQFAWRDTLGRLEGKKGKVTRIFAGSKHVNVKFGKDLIGIDLDQLEEY